MTRKQTCIVLRAVTTDREGETRTTFYGPFLPHYGSAASGMVAQLHDEAYALGAKEFDCYVEDVFVGPDESDAGVVATR